MTNTKPDAKNWQERNIEDWNVTTFTEFLKAKHKELFGIDYAPFGGTWGMEQRILGDLIGTKSKKGTANPEHVVQFIERTFEDYSPTRKYPGTSFGFMWTYRKNVWQQIQAEEKDRANIKRKMDEWKDVDVSDLSDWL